MYSSGDVSPKKRKTVHLHERRQPQADLSAQIATLLAPGACSPLPPGYRPRIGIPADLVWDQRRWPFVGAHAACVLAIENAGGDPCPFYVRPLRPLEDPFTVLWRQIRQYDGLCLPGTWGDIDPRFYGHHPHPQTEKQEEWLHWWMMHLALFATILRVPLLCICGGMQAWNVALGGTLVQDVRGQVRLRHMAGRPTPERWAVHPILLVPHTTLASYLPDEGPALSVPSAHNNAVCALIWDGKHGYTTPGLHHPALSVPRLQVSAVSPDQLVAVVEIVHAPGHKPLPSDFAFGFQDHLEWSTEKWATTIFRRYLEACHAYAARRQANSTGWENLAEPLRAALHEVQQLATYRGAETVQGGGAYAPALL